MKQLQLGHASEAGPAAVTDPCSSPHEQLFEVSLTIIPGKKFDCWSVGHFSLDLRDSWSWLVRSRRGRSLGIYSTSCICYLRCYYNYKRYHRSDHGCPELMSQHKEDRKKGERAVRPGLERGASTSTKSKHPTRVRSGGTAPAARVLARPAASIQSTCPKALVH